MIVYHLSVSSGQTHAQSNHHKGNLRNCRESQHTLDITLYASNCSGIECGKRTHPNNNAQCIGSILNPQGEQTGYLINTGNYHRRSMNQGTDRRRTFHCIGQPDMQREHGTLTGTTDKHQYQGRRQHVSPLGKSFCIEVKAERLAIITVNQNTDKEEHIGKTRHDERLLGSGNGWRRRVIEANQQIRGDTHQLPEQIHLENVGSYHQAEH